MSDQTPVDRKLLFDDSGGRGTWGGVYSTTLGSLLHEIGHLFDLDHTDRGIMGRGFDDVVCWVLMREPGCQSIHQSPSELEERWWLKWAGAKFDEASLVLLVYHRFFISNATDPDKSCVYDEDDCWVVKSGGVMGTKPDTSNVFTLGPCSQCETDNEELCQKYSNSILYYDNQYVRGVRINDVVFGDLTSQEVAIPCINRISALRIRSGQIIDAIQFKTTNTRTLKSQKSNGCASEHERETSEWFGGFGGSLTEILVPLEGREIRGTVSNFGDLACVSSLQVIGDQSECFVTLKSKREIVAVVFYCKVRDKVWCFRDFGGEMKCNFAARNDSNSRNMKLYTEHKNFTQDNFENSSDNMKEEFRKVRLGEQIVHEDKTRQVWSIKICGNLTDTTVKAVNIEGTVSCFSF